MERIPFYVISYNNGSLVKETVSQIKRLIGSGAITVLDNNSSCEETKRILNELEGVEVIWYEENRGPWRVLQDEEFSSVREKRFVLTDPDLELSSLPDNTLEVLSTVQKRHSTAVVGLALDISQEEDLFDYRLLGHTIISYESRCWVDRVEDEQYELYNADIDTTFALYDLNFVSGSIRVAELSVRHLPWHKSFADSLTEEQLITMYGNSPYSTISSFILRYRGVEEKEEEGLVGWPSSMFHRVSELADSERDVLFYGANPVPAILFLLTKFRSVLVIDPTGEVDRLTVENLLLNRYLNNIHIIRAREIKREEEIVAFCVDEREMREVTELLDHCKERGITVVVNEQGD